MPHWIRGIPLADLVLLEELRVGGIQPGIRKGLAEVHLKSETVLHLARRLRDAPPRTVLDVGASYGQFTVACSLAFPGVRVLSFEPNPGTLPVLAGTGARISGARVFPVALGAAEGTMALHVSRNPGSSSLLPMLDTHRAAFPDTEEVLTTPVEVRRLDDLLAGEALERPVLLKVDVQGYEDAVFAGAANTLAGVDRVLVEMSEVPLYEGQALRPRIEEILSSHGFVFEEVFERIVSPVSGETLQVDGLFRRARPPTSTR